MVNVEKYRVAIEAMKVEVVAVPVKQMSRLLDAVQAGQDAERALRNMGLTAGSTGASA